MIGNDAILPKTRDIDNLDSVLEKTPVTPRTRPADPYIPDKSQKRELSVGSTPSPSTFVQLDKKLKSDSQVFDWPDMEPATAEPATADVTLADIMAQLKLTAKVSDLADVAKKKDLVELQGIVSANSIEIQQLKDDLQTQSRRIQLLEESAGRQAASMLDRTKPDVDVNRINKYGGALSAPSQQNPRKRNLVFEGIPAMDEREVIGFVVQMCAALEIVAYSVDIEDVIPMRRRDGVNKPPPVLVTFAQLHIRSAILRRKYKLANMEKYSAVFVNPDEPVETRRAKAVFRRVGFQARNDGRSVIIRDDWIKIDEIQYRISDIDQIPEKYRRDITPPTANPGDDPGASNSRTVPIRSKNVKIKLTKAGLCFSGPSAFLSHMYRCSFTYHKVPYSSVEQGYHHLNAEFEGETEIAKAILDVHNPYDFKDLIVNLPKTDKWAAKAPGVMWDLNEAKYGQNPELKRQLLDTAPRKLIEASVDSKWGGACPFGSDIYEQGQVPGSNLCGEQLTKYRDDELAEMSNYNMS